MAFNIVPVPALNLRTASDLIAQIVHSGPISISSPFVTMEGVAKLLAPGVRVRLLTKVSASNIKARSLDSDALKLLLHNGAEIRSLYNLHAKIYSSGDGTGLVTSSNLTGPGLLRNVELGIHFEDESSFGIAVDSFFEKLWDRSKIVSVDTLEGLMIKAGASSSVQGIWYDSKQKQMPEPAIGPVYATSDVLILCDNQAQVFEEEGVIHLDRMPRANDLMQSMLSENPRSIQATLNTFCHAEDYIIAMWVEANAESLRDILTPSVRYPYKSYFVRRLIASTDVKTVSLVLERLLSDHTNESQFLKYREDIAMVISNYDHGSRTKMVDVAMSICDQILAVGRPDTCSKANALISHLEVLFPEIKGLVRGAAVETPSTLKVPSYQQIKRTREESADFGAAAKHWLSDIYGGQWDASPQNIQVLLSEVRKFRPAMYDAIRADKHFVDLKIRLRKKLVSDAAIVSKELKVLAEKNSLMTSVFNLASMDLDSGQVGKACGRLNGSSKEIKASSVSEEWRSLQKRVDALTTLSTYGRKL